MFRRGRWFFCKLSGRRRIGKTTLVQEALSQTRRRVLYLQVPDSAPSGVVASFNEALDVLEIPREALAPAANLRSVAQAIGALADRGTITILDEFQYFSRQRRSCTNYMVATTSLSSSWRGDRAAPMVISRSTRAR